MNALAIEMETRNPRFTVAPSRATLKHLGACSLLSSRSGKARRAVGECPRILLFVPTYTRLKEPAPTRSAFIEIGIPDFEVMKRAGTPIGLLRIATAAQKQGYEVKIVDSPFVGWDQEQVDVPVDQGHLIRYGLTHAQIKVIIERFEPDVIGIQCNYTVQWGNARLLADFIKSINSEMVVIGGGAHCSGDWEPSSMPATMLPI